MSNFLTLTFLGMSVLPIGFIALSLKLFEQLAVLNVSPSFLVQFLGDVSGRHLLDHNLVTQVQNTQKGLKWVPRCLFSTQSFDSWLSFFLSRQVIEKALDETFRQQTNCPQAPFGADMYDIHDSPGWKDLLIFTVTISSNIWDLC